ncbi:MAG TPA: carboxylating nicotinate-nucleotide diphosphorylase [Bdellovibrionales bacterium]|nr:nicotinate-nucleotide diphosphorylase (carboxylating) [Pseudobdellovibrionaceae bacterium]HAG91597.1 carboxylating nicotinate-nucleotide diphosphorylase [Bdellovibrionales bacterium]|tara:strand:+ start:1269 stop:2093 length:825 start_codon:yes stop_codon:yes gene_type:complete
MEAFDRLLDMAFEEDLPQGDITSEAVVPKDRMILASLKAKEDLVLSGKECFERAMMKIDPTLSFQWHFKDSDFVYNQQTVCLIEGSALSILKAERVALNFLGKLTGIATLTRCFVEKLHGTKTQILDTRKTTPGWRELEKKAVVHGGGKNHRMNLSDGILIKDNHIRAAGSIRDAVLRMRKHSDLPIVVECSDLSEVQQAVSENVDRILLDNMNLDALKVCLESIPGHIHTEASGNMNLERIRSVAELGIDFISVGQITHSAPCADLSLLFDWS